MPSASLMLLLTVTLPPGSVAADQETANAAHPPPDRHIRVFTNEQGLPSNVVFGLVQGPDGFLWVGTAAGLARFGGRAFTSVRPDLFGGGVHDLAASSTGALAVVERGRRELWIDGGSGRFELALGADGAPVRQVAWVRFDAEDRLWVVLEDGTLHRRDAEEGWLRRPVAGQAGARFARLFEHPEGGLWVTGWTRSGRATLWRTLSADRLERLATLEAGAILQVANGAGGGTWIGTRGAEGHRIRRLEGGVVRVVRALPGEVLGLATRGGVAYASHTMGLEAVDASGGVTPLRYPSDSQTGGPLLADQEGSLWSGSPTALFQFPEPRTLTWGTVHGLTSAHGENIEVSPAGVWVSTWQGLARLARGPDGWRGQNVQGRYDATYATRLCVDRDGQVWAQTADVEGRGTTLSRLDEAGPRRWEETAGPLDCATTPEGEIVAVAGRAVYEVPPEGPPVDLAPLPSFDGAGRPWIAAGEQGRIYVAWHPSLCEADRTELRAGGPEAWTCETLPDVGEIRDLATVEGPGGRSELWLASFSGGVLQRVDGTWREVPAMAAIEQRAAMGVTPSPSGGIWAFGFGFVVRLWPRGGQWEIVERLGGWHGIAGEIRSLVEERDGTVWLASWQGITRVPRGARSGPPPPPRVRLSGLVVDGLPARDGAGIALADHDVIDLVYEASALRDPRRLRYRVTVDDAPPVETSRERHRLEGLASGHHSVAVAASLDGERWSSEARLAFSVRPPWYSQPWVIVLVLLSTGGLIVARSRARTARLVELERQRTRIAMDLHDELGAGLGSLGILGGVLASDSVPPGERARIGARIARTAEELGGSLHDIVYSLRRGEGRIEGLAEQIVLRGRSLFSGDSVRFSGPAERPVPGAVEPTVSRQVYRIAVEAMNNAARHADASEVRLDLTTEPDGRVRLTVEDDGTGIEDESLSDPSGMGLVAMRRRAEEIGAELRIERLRGHGTRVELRFRPFPGKRPSLASWGAP